MRRKQRAAFIEKILDSYFPEPPIPLIHSSPYTLLIAVLLSARCTDERVNRITPELFRCADTPAKMVQLSIEKIQSLIRPCGLSLQKAKAIHALSEILLEQYDGEVPQTLKALEELPGVGHKTASVVITAAFHTPAFPVDTHILRSAKRWGLSTSTKPLQVEQDLKKCFHKNHWHKVHLQIIYFARAFCPARGHRPELCPICSKI